MIIIIPKFTNLLNKANRIFQGTRRFNIIRQSCNEMLGEIIIVRSNKKIIEVDRGFDRLNNCVSTEVISKESTSVLRFLFSLLDQLNVCLMGGWRALVRLLRLWVDENSLKVDIKINITIEIF